jgi:hypothetical protein
LEQLNQAALAATFFMRAMGLTLPGQDDVPTLQDTMEHLVKLTNYALGTYFDVQKAAPENQPANEIWGDEEDELFSVSLTGVSTLDRDGFTVSVHYNLFYR